jgi:hypothetical protein
VFVGNQLFEAGLLKPVELGRAHLQSCNLQDRIEPVLNSRTQSKVSRFLHNFPLDQYGDR